MKLLFHILAKDLRRLRWPVVVWVGVLLLPILLGVRVLTGEWAEAPTWRRWDDMNNYATFLRGMMAYLLTVLLVQEDAVVGTQQFWLTRPVSGRRMFTTKVVTGIMIFVVLPIAIVLPWWWWCGFGIGEILIGALELILFVGGIAVVTAFVATLTNSVARTLLWSLVMLAAVFAAFVLFVLFNMDTRTATQLQVMRGLVSVGVFVVASAVGSYLQYRRRDRRRVALMALGALAALGALQLSMTLWPSRWMQSPEPKEISPDRGKSVAVTFDQAWRFEGPETSKGRFDRLEVYFTATGVPDGSLLSGARSDHVWTWSNLELRRIESLAADGWYGRFRFLGMNDPALDPESERHRQELAQKNGWSYRPPIHSAEWRIRTAAGMPPSIARRTETEPPRYSARLWFALARPQLGYEMPLRVNERRAGGGHSLRLSSVRLGEEAMFTAIETHPYFGSQFLREILQRVLWFQSEPSAGFVLLNRERNEYLGLGGTRQSPIIPIYGVGINPRAPTRVGTRVWREGKWVERPGWLEGATLALFSMQTDAVFYRDVQVDRLPVQFRGPATGRVRVETEDRDEPKPNN